MISRLKNLLVTFLFSLLVTACGLPIQAASPSAPTADTGLLETIVAETFSAALQGTAATTPTITPTPPILNVETATPVPPAAGSTLSRLEDGTTLFVDDLTGLQVTVPAGWLALRVNEPEFLDAWNLAETADPAIQRSLSEIAEQDPDQFRLVAIDTQDGHIQNGFVTTIKFVWDEQTQMSFEDTSNLETVAASLTAAIPGMEILLVEVSTNTNGVPFGAISSRQPGKIGDDLDVIIYQKQVYLSAKTGTLVITLSTTEGLSEVVLPAFDAIIETIVVVQ